MVQSKMANMVDDSISKGQLPVSTKINSAPEMMKKVTNNEMLFNKASLCGLTRPQFHILRFILVYVLIATLFLYLSAITFIRFMAEFLGILLSLDCNIDIVVSCIFFATVVSFKSVEEMPLKVYDDFELKKKYEYNRNAARNFVMDHIKRFVVLLAFVTPIAATIVFGIQRSGHYCLITILPIFIALCLDKDDMLKGSIANLSALMNFLLVEVYILEEFKRLALLNIFCNGLSCFEQILLRGTLNGKENLTKLKEEKRNHGSHSSLRLINMMTVTVLVNLLTMFITCINLFRRHELLSEPIGSKHKKRSVLVGFFAFVIYVMESYNVLAKICLVALWQRFDYQKMASSERTYGDLIKMRLDNLESPKYDWNNSHHMLVQRFDKLEELDKAKKTQ